MFEDINSHRQAVQEQIQKGFEIGFTESELEKAHKVGDIHPNGKWVWTQLPSGRYDWRVIKKTSAPAGGAAPATAQKKEEKKISISANHPALGALRGVDAMKEYLTTFNSKYTDMSKVEVMRTPKGNWDVHYDGHRLGIFAGNQVPESTAKKMGWLRTDSKDLTRSKRDAEEEAKQKQGAVKSKKISPFVNKTVQMIKDHFGYGYNRNWTDEKIQKIQDALIENEEVAKKIMSTTFPAATWGIGGGKSIKVTDTDEFIFKTHASVDTTSRNPSFRGGTDYHYTISCKIGNSEKVIASGQHSTRSKWSSAAEVKSGCKVEALVRYLHISL